MLDHARISAGTVDDEGGGVREGGAAEDVGCWGLVDAEAAVGEDCWRHSCCCSGGELVFS